MNNDSLRDEIHGLIPKCLSDVHVGSGVQSIVAYINKITGGRISFDEALPYVQEYLLGPKLNEKAD